jgi:hypothetical protein
MEVKNSLNEPKKKSFVFFPSHLALPPPNAPLEF